MVIAFIPVRGGSKSIPLKNIKNFCDKPLIYWSLRALQDSAVVDEVFVGTDCNKIEEVVLGFCFSKVKIYKRDAENATDESSSESVILEFLNKYDFKDKDLFILVQATSPFVRAEDFAEALLKYNAEKADSLLTCVRSKRFFWSDDAQPINYVLSIRPRRQGFKGLLMENGAFYISTVGSVKKHKNRLSGKIAIYEMQDFAYIELDEDYDWCIAESLMRKYILAKEHSKKLNIKFFISDVDGTLTDAGMYYDQYGNELKKFNAHDGKGFELLRERGIKTGIITSENTNIVDFRARKLQVDYLCKGVQHHEKLQCVKEWCCKERMKIEEVAYIGDDVNCKNLLVAVGCAACPNNAVFEVKNIPGIIRLCKIGGNGAVREFIDIILKNIADN